jgi:uncharacterized membrane protein YedE/YeeE
MREEIFVVATGTSDPRTGSAPRSWNISTIRWQCRHCRVAKYHLILFITLAAKVLAAIVFAAILFAVTAFAAIIFVAISVYKTSRYLLLTGSPPKRRFNYSDKAHPAQFEMTGNRRMR